MNSPFHGTSHIPLWNVGQGRCFRGGDWELRPKEEEDSTTKDLREGGPPCWAKCGEARAGAWQAQCMTGRSWGRGGGNQCWEEVGLSGGLCSVC